MNFYLAIGVLALVVVLILLAHRFVDDGGSSLIRWQMIGALWDERERLRGAIAQHKLTHFETVQLQDRLREINEDLAALGVPRESLQ